MKPDEKTFFCELLSMIGLFYSKTLHKNDFEIYWNALQKYELDKIAIAFNQHIRHPKNGKFMPKPADILGFLEIDDEMKALYAWDYSREAVKKVGAYKSIDFEDPLTNAVVQAMGGWVKFCLYEEHELPFKAKEFQRRYLTYLLYSPSNIPKRLIGISEGDTKYQDHPHLLPPPVLFGNGEIKTPEKTPLLTSTNSKDEHHG